MDNKKIIYSLIALVAFVIIGAGGYFGLRYQNKKVAEQKEATAIVNENDKDINSLQSEIKSLDDLDLTELDDIDKELGQINLNGI